MEKSNLIVYSKPDCPMCVLTKNYLENRGLEYEERDISKKKDWEEEVLALGYMQLPVVVKLYPDESPHGVVRDSISGFNIPALDKLIESFE